MTYLGGCCSCRGPAAHVRGRPQDQATAHDPALSDSVQVLTHSVHVSAEGGLTDSGEEAVQCRLWAARVGLAGGGEAVSGLLLG